MFVEDLRPKTVKLVEENMGKRLIDIVLGNDILDITPKVLVTKAKTDK